MNLLATTNIASYAKTKEIITKYDFYFKKNYGQNFLIDGHVLNKIITGVDINGEDLVIEIGPGIGGLTEALCQRAKKVIAIEKDKSLIPILKELLADFSNLEIINGDALDFSYGELIRGAGFESAKVAANLPYYISTPMIMKLLEEKAPISRLVVMVQKEVAKRISAEPSTKDYGALSLAIGYYAKAKLIANVPRNCFIPRPGVDSALVRLDILKEPPVAAEDEKLMFEIIKSAFSQRRKTLLNCLYNTLGLSHTKEEYAFVLEKAGLLPDIRGEDLSLNDFAVLAGLITSL